MTHSAKNKGILLMLPSGLAADCGNRQWLDCAKDWARRGGRSVIAAARGALRQDFERSGIQYFALPQGRRMLSRWQRTRRIKALLRQFQPRRVWLQDAADLAAFDGQRRDQARCFLSAPPVHARTRALLCKFIAAGGRVAADSEGAAAALEQACALPAGRIERLPPAVDMLAFDAGRVTPERALKLAEDWRVPENAVLFLHLGPLCPGGGQELLLQTMALMKRRDLYAVMLGADIAPGYRQHLKNDIARHKLLGQVLLVDDCADLAAALWFAHVVLAVGEAENQARFGAMPEILAAQAMGRPLVVGESSARLELVAPGETAWVTAADPAALKAVLNEILGLSLQEKLRLSLRMRRWVETHFPYESWMEAMMG